tara:strand:- start:312 stop:1043 length:732 start_codon:yes stop_codon:yes gene_type:complete
VHKVAHNIVHRINKRRPKKWQPRDVEGEVRFHQDASFIDMSEGNWLALASCGYMLDDLQMTLRSLGLPYHVDGKSPIRENLIKAVSAWKRLEDQSISYSDVMAIYANLKVGENIQRGYKGGKTLEENKSYNLEELTMHHGLINAGQPWDITFKSMGDIEKSYLQSLELHGGLDQRPKINLSTIHKSKGGECDNVVLMTDLSRANQDEMEIDSDDTNRVFYVGVTRAKKSLHIIEPQKERGFII